MWDLNEDYEHYYEEYHHHADIEVKDYTMEVVVIVASVVGIVILILLLCKCCNRSRYRGQVIAPPAVTTTQSTVTVQAPYPQQQYVVQSYPAHPPSYEDVMGGVASSTPSAPNVKQPPYNPYLSH